MDGIRSRCLQDAYVVLIAVPMRQCVDIAMPPQEDNSPRLRIRTRLNPNPEICEVGGRLGGKSHVQMFPIARLDHSAPRKYWMAIAIGNAQHISSDAVSLFHVSIQGTVTHNAFSNLSVSKQASAAIILPPKSQRSLCRVASDKSAGSCPSARPLLVLACDPCHAISRSRTNGHTHKRAHRHTPPASQQPCPEREHDSIGGFRSRCTNGFLAVRRRSREASFRIRCMGRSPLGCTWRGSCWTEFAAWR